MQCCVFYNIEEINLKCQKRQAIIMAFQSYHMEQLRQNCNAVTLKRPLIKTGMKYCKVVLHEALPCLKSISRMVPTVNTSIYSTVFAAGLVHNVNKTAAIKTKPWYFTDNTLYVPKVHTLHTHRNLIKIAIYKVMWWYQNIVIIVERTYCFHIDNLCICSVICNIVSIPGALPLPQI